MNADGALAPVLRDVAATCPLPVRVRPQPDDPDSRWISVDGVSAIGIVVAADDPVVRAADDVADWLVEQLPAAGLAATWPVCPGHPGTHPLVADRAGNDAVWRCPRSGTVHARIGELAAG